MRGHSTSDAARIRCRFSKAAPQYDRYAAHHRMIARELLRHLAGLRCQRILELGCGTGILSRGLKKLFPESSILLTDSAPGMVSVCRTRVHPSSLVRHSLWDFESAEFPGSFDLAVSSCALQWLARPEEFGKRLFHAVSPGGWTAHAIPVTGMLRELESSFLGTGCTSPSLDYLSGEEWNGVFSEAGFAIAGSLTRRFTVMYPSPADAVRAVNGIGASLSGLSRGDDVSPAALRRALGYYGERFGAPCGEVPASYEVHFLLARRSGD